MSKPCRKALPEPAALGKGSKGQQRAACCVGLSAQMGMGYGPAAAGEELCSLRAPSWLLLIFLLCKHPALQYRAGGRSLE